MKGLLESQFNIKIMKSCTFYASYLVLSLLAASCSAASLPFSLGCPPKHHITGWDILLNSTSNNLVSLRLTCSNGLEDIVNPIASIFDEASIRGIKASSISVPASYSVVSCPGSASNFSISQQGGGGFLKLCNATTYSVIGNRSVSRSLYQCQNSSQLISNITLYYDAGSILTIKTPPPTLRCSYPPSKFSLLATQNVTFNKTSPSPSFTLSNGLFQSLNNVLTVRPVRDEDPIVTIANIDSFEPNNTVLCIRYKVAAMGPWYCATSGTSFPLSTFSKLTVGVNPGILSSYISSKILGPVFTKTFSLSLSSPYYDPNIPSLNTGNITASISINFDSTGMSLLNVFGLQYGTLFSVQCPSSYFMSNMSLEMGSVYSSNIGIFCSDSSGPFTLSGIPKLNASNPIVTLNSCPFPSAFDSFSAHENIGHAALMGIGTSCISPANSQIYTPNNNLQWVGSTPIVPPILFHCAGGNIPDGVIGFIDNNVISALGFSCKFANLSISFSDLIGLDLTTSANISMLNYISYAFGYGIEQQYKIELIGASPDSISVGDFSLYTGTNFAGTVMIANPSQLISMLNSTATFLDISLTFRVTSAFGHDTNSTWNWKSVRIAKILTTTPDLNGIFTLHNPSCTLQSSGYTSATSISSLPSTLSSSTLLSSTTLATFSSTSTTFFSATSDMEESLKEQVIVLIIILVGSISLLFIAFFLGYYMMGSIRRQQKRDRIILNPNTRSSSQQNLILMNLPNRGSSNSLLPPSLTSPTFQNSVTPNKLTTSNNSSSNNTLNPLWKSETSLTLIGDLKNLTINNTNTNTNTNNSYTNLNSPIFSDTSTVIARISGNIPLAVPGYLRISLENDLNWGTQSELENIGVGRTAILYRAKVINPSLMKKWNTKRVAVKLVTDRSLDSMFLFEVALLGSLPPHPNILTFFGYFDEFDPLTENPIRGMVLKLYHSSLSALLFNPDLNFVPNQMAFIAIRIARAMRFLHDHDIIHFDLKPLNILVDRLSDVAINVVVNDFGCARTIGGDMTDTKTRLVAGLDLPSQTGLTIGYSSPELLLQFQTKITSCTEDHKKVDVYAFGITLFEIITQVRAWSTIDVNNLVNTPGQTLVQAIFDGVRPVFPSNWNNESKGNDGNLLNGLRMLVIDCWNSNIQARPSFKEIISRIESLIDPGVDLESIRISIPEDVNKTN